MALNARIAFISQLGNIHVDLAMNVPQPVQQYTERDPSFQWAEILFKVALNISTSFGAVGAQVPGSLLGLFHVYKGNCM